MQVEEKIIGMLEQIMSKQDDHSRILDEHSHILSEHSKKLDEHNKKLDLHSSTLGEHGQILTALRSGQEYLKAEMDGMKVSNTRKFGELKGEISEFESKIEVLRDDTWVNKTDIHRIKTTMGMS